MHTKKKTKFIHSGRFVAEVDVNLQIDNHEWSPYLTVEDARKIDFIRKALKNRDLKTISGMARIFEKTPVHL